MLKCLEGKQGIYQHSSSSPSVLLVISFFFNDFHSVVPRLFNINNLKSYLLVLLLPGLHHAEPPVAGTAGRNVTGQRVLEERKMLIIWKQRPALHLLNLEKYKIL